MKYRTEGIGKNKKIRKERNKPLPLEVMYNEKLDTVWLQRRGDSSDSDDMQIIPGAEGSR